MRLKTKLYGLVVSTITRCFQGSELYDIKVYPDVDTDVIDVIDGAETLNKNEAIEAHQGFVEAIKLGYIHHGMCSAKELEKRLELKAIVSQHPLFV